MIIMVIFSHFNEPVHRAQADLENGKSRSAGWECTAAATTVSVSESNFQNAEPLANDADAMDEQK
jgi:hypothetical protein